MPIVDSHAPGSFCWIELATTDAHAAREFYKSLFRWTVNENDMGEMGIYYIFQKDGRDCAAMYQMGAQQQGMPPNWLSYVAVANADQSTEKAKSLGGNVVMGPFDVDDHGRMAVIGDPQGAYFAIWQAIKNPGIKVRDEVNSLCWNELSARDLDASKKFYPALFGWRMKESPEYTEWHLGEHAVGGMMQSQAPAEVPPYWLPYFAVADCDASVASAQSLGAHTLVPPMDIPKVGRFAVLADPQGATFAVIKLAM
ncbi:MAG: VOC family protein [Thermoanaerobaculia bacterium]